MDATSQYRTDVLGEPYQARILTLPDDDEGEVVATLVRRTCPGGSRRAVVYVHGFLDYFFQRHLADFYVGLGFDFYALDLRKSGRSLLEHQSAYFIRSVAEYFAEVDLAVAAVREEGHDVVVLSGHSTGGLTCALWAHRTRGEDLIDGLYLNSPFFELNYPWIVRKIADGLAWAGKRRPYTSLGRAESLYVQSIHRDHRGEWDFDLTWKPLSGLGVRLGWLHAIRRAHRRLWAGLEIDVPVLVHCSTASHRGRRWHENMTRTDVVLDVDHIARYSLKLGPHVTLVRLPDALHDVALSAPQVRAGAFADLGRWLAAFVPESVPPPSGQDAAPPARE